MVINTWLASGDFLHSAIFQMAQIEIVDIDFYHDIPIKRSWFSRYVNVYHNVVPPSYKLVYEPQ